MSTPLPVIDHVYRCAFRFKDSVTTQTAVNVMHFEETGSGATAADLYSKFQAHVTAGMWTLVSGDVAVYQIDVTPLDGMSATESFTTGSGAIWQGQGTGVYAPQAACVIKWQSNLRGRDNRGRIFLPFLPSAANSNGSLNNTEVATTQTAWNAFVSSMVGASPSYQLGIAAYDRAHAGAGAHFTPLLSLSVETIAGTQRRRQGRLRG